MKPEAQRIAIAEACGECVPEWRFNGGGHVCTKCGKLDYDGGHSPQHPVQRDYLNDLNAMHEAEKTLNEKQQVWYLQKLTQVRFQDGVRGMIGCMIDKTTFATAAQRAEAFLRTIGKWTDD